MDSLQTLFIKQEAILFVTAHPDDSAILLGGTLQTAIQSNGAKKVHVLVASDGERGENRLPHGDAHFVKDGGRLNEEQAALTHLGILRENMHFAHLPDGSISGDNELVILTKHILSLCELHNITLFVTLGPQSDGHPDHAATHSAALRAAKQHRGVSILSLNAHHTGHYKLELTPDQSARKFEAASRHVSQYSAPGWLVIEKGVYTMGPAFSHMSSFYPPLAKRETFDIMNK